MKKYNYKSETGGMGGCIVAGLQLTFIFSVIIVICLILSSCSSTKNGCGSYDHWQAKHSFNK